MQEPRRGSQLGDKQRVEDVPRRGTSAVTLRSFSRTANGLRFLTHPQVDTLSAHRSIDKADHYARDNVGIAKPPDVTWWPWLLLAGLLVGFCIVIWLQDRGK